MNAGGGLRIGAMDGGGCWWGLCGMYAQGGRGRGFRKKIVDKWRDSCDNGTQVYKVTDCFVRPFGLQWVVQR